MSITDPITWHSDAIMALPFPISKQSMQLQKFSWVNTGYYTALSICENWIFLFSVPKGEFGIHFLANSVTLPLASESCKKGLSQPIGGLESRTHQQESSLPLTQLTRTSPDTMEWWMGWRMEKRIKCSSCPYAGTKVENNLHCFFLL